MNAATITYRETTALMRRVFKLNQSTVEVELTSLNRDAQDIVNLSDLRPEPERLRVRQIIPLRVAGVFLIVGIVGLGLGFAFQNGVENKLKEMTISIGGAALFLGVLTLLVFGRKFEAVRFKNSTGVCLLDVLKSGPDRLQYDSFVSVLIDRIRAANGEREAATHPKT